LEGITKRREKNKDLEENSQTMFSSPISSRTSIFAPSNVPKIKHPFITNFMIPVPEASLPGVLNVNYKQKQNSQRQVARSEQNIAK
jgi:hypothetical protein